MNIFIIFSALQAFHYSCSLECKGIYARSSYIKKIRQPKYTIKLFTIPANKLDDFGKISVYELDTTEDAIRNTYNDSYQGIVSWNVFQETLDHLNKLIYDIEHRKTGNDSSAYLNTYKGGNYNDSTPLFEVEGISVRTRIADQSVFESAEKIKLVVGFQLIRDNPIRALKKFIVQKIKQNMTLDFDYLMRAGVIAQRSENKPIEVLVIGTENITEADIQHKIDQIMKDGAAYKRFAEACLPKERHSALMGGLGISVGLHQHTKKFIFNLRTGIDYIWGKFCQSALQVADTENILKLGWGTSLDSGVEYKFTTKTTIGFEAGMRFGEFKVPTINQLPSTKSSWFIAPYAHIICGFYPTPYYSISFLTGYIFPRTFEVNAQDTCLAKATKAKVDGMYSGIRLSWYY